MDYAILQQTSSVATVTALAAAADVVVDDETVVEMVVVDDAVDDVVVVVFCCVGEIAAAADAAGGVGAYSMTAVEGAAGSASLLLPLVPLTTTQQVDVLPSKNQVLCTVNLLLFNVL